MADNETFKCPYCDFESVSKAGLTNHIKAQHPEEYKKIKEKVNAKSGSGKPKAKSGKYSVIVVNDHECEINKKKYVFKKGKKEMLSPHVYRTLKNGRKEVIIDFIEE